jgi:hypothetical protein
MAMRVLLAREIERLVSDIRALPDRSQRKAVLLDAPHEATEIRNPNRPQESIRMTVEPINSFEPIGDAAKRVVEKIAPSSVFSPGVYFGLDEDRYHADPALGSSHKKKLLGDPAAYWWDSPLNPAREEKEDTPAIIRGRRAQIRLGRPRRLRGQLWPLRAQGPRKGGHCRAHSLERRRQDPFDREGLRPLRDGRNDHPA